MPQRIFAALHRCSHRLYEYTLRTLALPHGCAGRLYEYAVGTFALAHETLAGAASCLYEYVLAATSPSSAAAARRHCCLTDATTLLTSSSCWNCRRRPATHSTCTRTPSEHHCKKKSNDIFLVNRTQHKAVLNYNQNLRSGNIHVNADIRCNDETVET